MRIFDFKKICWDIKFIIVYFSVLLLSIILGIVLYNIAKVNMYFYDFANDYIYCIFNFSNGALFFSHLISELFYLYVVFFIAYFTKLKYLTLIVIFIKSLFVAIYCAVLCGIFGFGGIMVSVFVYIPISLISFVACLFLIEACRVINRKYAFAFPAIVALLISLILLIFVNVLFRMIIIIV